MQNHPVVQVKIWLALEVERKRLRWQDVVLHLRTTQFYHGLRTQLEEALVG